MKYRSKGFGESKWICILAHICPEAVVTLLEQYVSIREGFKYSSSCLLALHLNLVSLTMYRQ